MPKNKVYIVLIVIFIGLFTVLFFAFGVKNILQDSHEATIIVGENTMWKYENRHWRSLSTISQIQKMNWDKYEVFIDNEAYGNYYLWHDDRWYLFDEEKNSYPVQGNLLAYRANYDLKVTGFLEEEILDTTYAQSVMMNYGISPSSKFTTSTKISFDFDLDGVVEDFYVVSNAFPIDFEPETIFSFVFMVKNEEITMIYQDISSNHSFNGCKPFFYSFLDVDSDKPYEFILSCGRYSIEDQVDMLYQYDQGEFKILVSN